MLAPTALPFVWTVSQASSNCAWNDAFQVFRFHGIEETVEGVLSIADAGWVRPALGSIKPPSLGNPSNFGSSARPVSNTDSEPQGER